jgi:hypothetical protein
LYPEAKEKVEKTREDTIAYMLEEFPTVENFDEMIMT